MTTDVLEERKKWKKKEEMATWCLLVWLEINVFWWHYGVFDVGTDDNGLSHQGTFTSAAKIVHIA